jgi:predicted nucleic acid-binding protein
MTTAILDTNVLIQGVIGSPRAAAARTLRAYRDKRYQLVFSLDTLEEFHDVFTLPTGLRSDFLDRHSSPNHGFVHTRER